MMTAEVFTLSVPLGDVVRQVMLLSVKSALILFGVMLLLRAMKGASSHARHQILLATMSALIILPLFTFGLPSWNLPLISIPEMAPATNPESSTQTGGAVTVPSESVAGSGREIEARGTGGSKSAPAEAGIPVAAFIVPLWFAGAAVVFIVHAFRIAGIHLMVAWSRPTPDERLNELFVDCVDDIGVKGRVRLLVSDLAAVPMNCGFFRGSVILPAEAAEWSDDRVRAILLHELTHALRRDNLAQLLVSLACALNWFNPLVWIASKRLVFEREKACDDSVLRVGTAASSYARVLLSIAESLQGEKRRLMPAAMAKESDVKGRLKAILSTGVDRGEFGILRSSVVFLAAMLIMLPVATLSPWGEVRAMPEATDFTEDAEEAPDKSVYSRDDDSDRNISIARKNLDGRAYDFYYHKKNYAAAVALFDKVRASYPFTSHIHVMAGHCKYKLGDFEGAVTAYRMSEQLLTRFENLYYYIAGTYFRLGEKQLGYHYLYRGMQVAPDYDFENNQILQMTLTSSPRGKALLEALAYGNIDDLEDDYLLPSEQLGSVPRLERQPVTEEVNALITMARTSPMAKQREEAVEWLGAHGSTEALETLVHVLETEMDEDVLEETVEAMAETFLPDYLDRLIETARVSRKPVVRIEAAKYLASIYPDEAEALLRSVLNEPYGGDAHRDALKVFIRFGLDQARSALEDIAANHESLRIRALARSMLSRGK